MSLAATGAAGRFAVAVGVSSVSIGGEALLLAAGCGLPLAVTRGAERLAVAAGGSSSFGEARMMGGGPLSSGAGAGRASESGGASEVWHLALSSSQKLADKNPRTNSAALFIRIPANHSEINNCGPCPATPDVNHRSYMAI